MYGVFNGVRLSRIVSIVSVPAMDGSELCTFHAIERSTELESELRLGEAGLLILATRAFEGKIVAYAGDSQNGFDVTLELKGARS